MENRFVELNRSFAPIPKEFSFNEEDYESEITFGLLDLKKWDDLLKLKRVIILAEAGAGKTEEMRATSNKLRNDSKKAFFLRLEHLSSDFETALEIGSYAEFKDWLTSDETSWFFLDSVDEAKLCGPKQFDAAIRKFAQKLGEHKQRAHVYITSRLSEWGPQSDLSLIKDKLPFRESPPTTENGEESEPYIEDNISSSVATSINAGNPKIVEPEVFALRPLDQEQIRVFSKADDIQDLDAFISEIERAEAEVFCERPEDLLNLINFWKNHGEIGNRSRMIEESIKVKLIERDPERAKVLALSHEEALYGVEMLAAASTFMKKNRILVPEVTIDPGLNSEAIDVQSVLSTWNFAKLRALLQLPIFDEAIYGAVRFHHRSVKEYLTAKWLSRLLLAGKSSLSIERLFFAKRYNRKVLIPSMRPILAWLILFDDRIRDKAIEISPEISIQGGDPSVLPLEVRKGLLERFCSHYSDQGARGLSFDISDLKRFAHPDLADTINHLLETYSENIEIRRLLLRIIWQGEIEACSAKALEFSKNNKCDTYTRNYGIRAVGVAGSETQKRELVDSFLSDTSFASKGLIGQLINSFAPEILAIQDIPIMLQRIEKVDRYSANEITWSLREFVLQKCPVSDILGWIHGLIPLIKRHPVIERKYYEVSEKFSWLLPCAVLSVERLVALKHPDALNESALEIISLAQSSISWGGVHFDNKRLQELVPQWWELNKTLFWFNVESTRTALHKKKNKKLTEYWQVLNFVSFWKFNKTDFDEILKDVSNKSNMDDRLVALSLSFSIYFNSGRSQAQLVKMNKAVKGVKVLKKALECYLNPPQMSEEEKQWKREEERYKGEEEQRKIETAENQKKWRELLQENIHILRDTSIANEGKIWNATKYLMDRLRKQEFSNNKWSNPHWEALIPEFGNEVAEAYRDGCIDYWRKYRPKIMSEGIENPNNTPNAVVLGLSGLDMEAHHNSNWPANLTEEEAILACRYAVNELNGFPDWFLKLHENFPTAVEELLIAEIEWEFALYSGDDNCNYVMADVDWQLDWIKPKLSLKTLELLAYYEPKHDDTVRIGLGIVLSDVDLDKERFLEIVKEKVQKVNGSRQAIWLAAWMSVEAKGAYEALESILENIGNPEGATSLSMHFIISLLGDRRKISFAELKSYMEVEFLLPLYKLMNKYIRITEDTERDGTGVYSPGLRDNAQEGRDRLFELLKNIPGKASYLAMMDLSQHHPDESSRPWFEERAKQRAEKDSEISPWEPGDIASFAEDAERSPHHHRELYDLVVSRLYDLKADLENGDASISPFLQLDKDETKHRNFIGGWLRDHSRGRYSVPQEEELADAKRPDIRIHGCGFDGPVPIELKIADKRTVSELLERLRNQLCGDYLRDIRSNCGIYLLIYFGTKTWRHPSKKGKLGFSELLQLIEGEADAIVTSHEKVEAVQVIGVDLTVRAN